MKNEKKISPQIGEEPSTEAIIRFLTERGLLADVSVSDERCRAAKQKRAKDAFHNTLLMLKHYRNIAWLLECFPDTVASELERPFESLDHMIESLDVELSWGNKKMEHRLAGMEKSRLLLDRIHEALTALRKKPEDGQKLYDLIYMTYIAPEILKHEELLYRLDLSSRHYYRLREQAVQILSLRLWAAPSGEADAWLGLISLLEAGKN